MNTFPAESGPYGVSGSVPVYTDPACRNQAPIFDGNGAQLRNNAPILVTGRIAPFQSTASVLYIRYGVGNVITLYPAIVNKTPPTVTGSKGGNAALASLVGALAAAGVIVDTTS